MALEFNYDEEIKYDTQINRGRSFELVFRDPRSNINFAGFSYAGQVYKLSTGAVVATFSVTKDDNLQQATFSLTPAQTTALTAGQDHIYDIQETTDTGQENQAAWGHIPIYDTVTP
jgi:hypothetical protein